MNAKLRRKRLYNLTDEEEQRLDAQGEACAICSGNRSKKALCVDHNHDTKKVRGLLCHSCNTAFGLMEENVEWLQEMIEYKLKHR